MMKGLVLALLALAVLVGAPATAPAAISVVQTATSACGNTVTCTTPNINTSSGNAVIILLSYYNGFSSVSDNNALSWTQADTEQDDSAATVKMRIYFNCNITGKTGHNFSMTVAASSFPQITAVEVSGLVQDSGTCLDKTAKDSSATGTSHATPATATTAQANELLVGIAGALVNTFTTDTGAGWTQRANYSGVNNSQVGHLAGTKIVSATDTYTYSYTTGSNCACGNIIATFKEAAAGGGFCPSYIIGQRDSDRRRYAC
jgi:hypothetical protein